MIPALRGRVGKGSAAWYQTLGNLTLFRIFTPLFEAKDM